MKKIASLAIASIAAVSFASSAFAFNASGQFWRDDDGTGRFVINNEDNGKSYNLYGTDARCDGRGEDYNVIGGVINSMGGFKARIAGRCGSNVKFCIKLGGGEMCTTTSGFRVNNESSY